MDAKTVQDLTQHSYKVKYLNFLQLGAVILVFGILATLLLGVGSAKTLTSNGFFTGLLITVAIIVFAFIILIPVHLVYPKEIILGKHHLEYNFLFRNVKFGYNEISSIETVSTLEGMVKNISMTPEYWKIVIGSPIFQVPSNLIIRTNHSVGMGRKIALCAAMENVNEFVDDLKSRLPKQTNKKN